jgi:hypothetical protein
MEFSLVLIMLVVGKCVQNIAENSVGSLIQIAMVSPTLGDARLTIRMASWSLCE